MRRFLWPAIVVVIALVLLACWGAFGLVRRLPIGTGVYPPELEMPLVIMAILGFIIETAIFPIMFFVGTMGLDGKGYARFHWKTIVLWVATYLILALSLPYFWSHWDTDSTGVTIDAAKNVLAALSYFIFIVGIFSR